MTLNSKFRNMFSVGKQSIDDEYAKKIRQLERNRQESLEEFRLNAVPGVTNKGFGDIENAFKEQFAKARQDYRDQISDYRKSLERKQFASQAMRG